MPVNDHTRQDNVPPGPLDRLAWLGSRIWLVLVLALLPQSARAQGGGSTPAPGSSPSIAPPPVPGPGFNPSPAIMTTPSPLIDASGRAPRIIEGPGQGTLAPIQATTPPSFPTVIPVDTSGPQAIPATNSGTANNHGPQGRVIQLVPDTTGLVPERPPGPTPHRPVDQVKAQLSDLFEFVQEPEAEFSVPVGHTKLIETRRTAHTNRDRQSRDRRPRDPERSAQLAVPQPLRAVVRNHQR